MRLIIKLEDNVRCHSCGHVGWGTVHHLQPCLCLDCLKMPLYIESKRQRLLGSLKERFRILGETIKNKLEEFQKPAIGQPELGPRWGENYSAPPNFKLPEPVKIPLARPQ